MESHSGFEDILAHKMGKTQSLTNFLYYRIINNTIVTLTTSL